MEKGELREYLTDAIKFWEPWRLVYNLALAVVVIIYFAIAYPVQIDLDCRFLPRRVPARCTG